MKKVLLGFGFLLCVFLSGCAITGEAEDKWDEEEKQPKISLNDILGKSKQKKENEELKARIERLERGTGATPSAVVTNDSSINNVPPTTIGNAGGITPPSMNRSSASTSSNGSVSFKEWQAAKNSNSDEYKQFKEYQEWLEFQRIQKKP